MQADFSKSRIAVLGAGKMGGILIKALVEKHQLLPERVRATVGHESRARDLSHKLGVVVTTDNLTAVAGADIIFVCVKPQVVQELMEQIRPKVSPRQLVISVAASVHTSPSGRWPSPTGSPPPWRIASTAQGASPGATATGILARSMIYS